ncbi:MAG: hypothetical protein AT710_00105 [Thermocladium sp. ECH_B]|nr:MAG: hypothetical protein AT710_00105 [Thermocladium sp. ECH_B]
MLGVVTIREVLNKLKWTGSAHDYYVTYVSRGAPNDEVTIPASSILELLHDGFLISVDGRETYIPYHRVTLIQSRTGTILLDRRRH